MLASYACTPAETRGRLYDENESAFRSPFQRDRDRIIHSSAFRRLKHKTQVFVEHEGDYYRTRLTHSIEVAQVARTIAGALGFNEYLTEGVALAHDLGHTPFGHTGEDALNALMKPYGGFDHNAQALKIVTSLERHYAEWDGLNLTWESLEGIAKHNGPVTLLRGDGPVTGDLPFALADYNARHDLELHTHASGEAQVAAISDDIAYNNHDLHDGLRAGLFTVAEICDLPIVGRAFAEVDRKYPGLGAERRRHEALRRVFGVMVEDVLITSRRLLQEVNPGSAGDIRMAGRPVIRFSDHLFNDLKEIRAFLFKRMYRAPSVVAMREQVTRVVEELFPLFMNDTALLPEDWREDVARAQSETELARIVGDYIAGMTDRFALETHKRLIG
ncbi:deoxyguanosinetriphosphate triphosphohydrolase [Sinisalibacter aestuarii]|uniref:Deoxyguanosinetriphosphate triphosphohydrolase-like protein n=1 Tax=Sinisalibacter aestuarii TaxID=2949426 RepID=A0ABQ5LSG0_9RHOB|nr:deoxyguanosinetriphosphate triphosphohydrolase [Sinisalibacter aestuarii]GKY87558.1 deoxyguanosinetriphosphate triphosphohydrolase-like protein [Sinisalibacter aestuarii]